MSRVPKLIKPVFVDMEDYYKIIITSIKYGVHEALFDKDDFDIISKHYWGLNKSNSLYARTIINKKQIRMHNLLFNNIMVDHKNNNSLDNRRSNLREATYSQNNMNMQIRSSNTTGFKGVYLTKSNKSPYWAYLSKEGKRYGGGCFKTAKEAAKKYNELALLHHGKFANLNIIK